jgi:predicted RNA binding protein YcfA (HicA-like mRNA interferase family)
MSDKLPRVTASDIVRVLAKKGFSLTRQSGSHKIFKNNKGNRVTVPFHSGKTINPKILLNILKDADIDIETFKKEI